jgi:hypothetical protein
MSRLLLIFGVPPRCAVIFGLLLGGAAVVAAGQLRDGASKLALAGFSS